MKRSYLVLDAMGVLYKHCDDVAELLIPFIQEKGSSAASQHIKDSYHETSLGRQSSSEFWQSVGLEPVVEDEYLSRFQTTHNLIPALTNAESVWQRISCLSNDVAEWSQKLRDGFGLTSYIKDWFISGDLHCRKPSAAIYEKMLNQLGCVSPQEVVFVDDRSENLIAAQKLGMNPVMFTGNSKDQDKPNWAGLKFHELKDLVHLF